MFFFGSLELIDALIKNILGFQGHILYKMTSPCTVQKKYYVLLIKKNKPDYNMKKIASKF